VQGIVTPAQRGQETVDQGIILVGRESDNGIVPPGKRMLPSEFPFSTELACHESKVYPKSDMNLSFPVIDVLP
jgi:hypothetical protein